MLALRPVKETDSYFMHSSSISRRRFLQQAGVAAVAASTLPRVLAQAQTDHKIVLALVGVAHIHTPGFVDLMKKRNDVRVKWVWDPEPVRAEKPATDLGA